MTYDFDDDSADYRRLNEKIDSLQKQVDSIPVEIPDVSRVVSDDTLLKRSNLLHSVGGRSSTASGTQTDYSDLGTQDGTSSLSISVSGEKRFIRKITLGNSAALTFGVSSTNIPSNKTVELYLWFFQDSTGNRSLATPSSTVFPNGNLFDTKLDKTANAKTLFRLTTVDGGSTWFSEVVRLESGTGGGGSTTLAGLTDTNVPSPSDGQVLSYDNSTSKWVARAVNAVVSAGTIDARITNAINTGGIIASYIATLGYSTAAQVSSAISSAISGITSYIGTNASQFAQKIISSLGTTWTNLTSLLSTVSNNITTWLQNRGTEIRAALGTTFTNAVSWVQGLTNTVRTRITNAASWVASATANVRNVISSAATQIQSALGTAWTNLTSLLSTVSNNISDWIKTIFRNFVNKLPGASLVSETLDAIFNKFNELVPSGNPSSTNTNNSAGDIDLKTWDIRNVDRIFFESNDALDNTDTRPQISSYRTSSNTGWLEFLVPSATSRYNFYVNTTSNNLMSIVNDGVRIFKNLLISDKINVGTDTSTKANGDIWRDSSGNVMTMTGDSTKSFSDIGGGGNDDLLFQNLVRTGLIIKLPILATSTTLSAISVSALDTAFGSWDGAMGIATNTAGTATPYLYVKRGLRWASMFFNDDTITSSTGRRFNASGHTIQKVHARITSATSSPNGSTSFDNFSKSTFLLYGSSSTATPTFAIKDNAAGNDDWTTESFTSRGVSNAGGLPEGSDFVTVGIIPTIDDDTPSASQLEANGRVDDGNIVYDEDEEALWVKVGGKWYEKEF